MSKQETSSVFELKVLLNNKSRVFGSGFRDTQSGYRKEISGGTGFPTHKKTPKQYKNASDMITCGTPGMSSNYR